MCQYIVVDMSVVCPAKLHLTTHQRQHEGVVAMVIERCVYPLLCGRGREGAS